MLPLLNDAAGYFDTWTPHLDPDDNINPAWKALENKIN
jgi:hypothetical protein